MSACGRRRGCVFETVSARPATMIGLGTTKPWKLLTPTHCPPSLVVKRAVLLLLPMVKGGGAKVPLPMTKLFTTRPATENDAGTLFASVRSIAAPSARTKSGGFDAHSYTRSPPASSQHSWGRPQPLHEFGSGHICWAHAVPASRIVVTHARILILICFPPSVCRSVDGRQCRARAPGRLSPVGAPRAAHLVLLVPACHRCAWRRAPRPRTTHRPTRRRGGGARTPRSVSPAPSPPGGARGMSPL